MRLLLFLAFTFSLPSLVTVRANYKKAIASEAEAEKLMDLLENVSSKEPVLLAYKGAVTALMAKHVYSPYSKVSYVKEAYAILNEAVEADSANTEVRYIRYSIEYNIPAFLPYRDHLDADKAFVISSILDKEHTLNKEVLKEIGDFMLKNAELDALTKAKLKEAIS